MWGSVALLLFFLEVIFIKKPYHFGQGLNSFSVFPDYRCASMGTMRSPIIGERRIKNKMYPSIPIMDLTTQQ